MVCNYHIKYSNVESLWAQAVKHGSIDHCSSVNNPAFIVPHHELQHPQHVNACMCSQPLATRKSMCRDCDFVGQQQIASKLHKLVGASDDYYVWWAIAAITLQAKAAQKGAASALPADKLFQLAEVMTAKQAQKGSLQTYEQLSLYLDILQVATHSFLLGFAQHHTCMFWTSMLKLLYFIFCGQLTTQTTVCLTCAMPDCITCMTSCTRALWNYPTVTWQE